jgi:hypothetical protein
LIAFTHLWDIYSSELMANNSDDGLFLRVVTGDHSQRQIAMRLQLDRVDQTSQKEAARKPSWFTPELDRHIRPQTFKRSPPVSSE